MRRVLIVVLATLSLPAAAAEPRIEIEPRAGTDLGSAVLEVASEGEVVQRPLRSGRVAPGAAVTCRGNAVWCPTVRVLEEGVSLPVFSALQVQGRIENWKQWPQVSSGSVQGVVRDAVAGELDLVQDFTVEDGRFQLLLPRTTLDLRFAFAGAAPVYRWRLDLSSAEPAKVAPLRLQAGGSVSGWVESRQSHLPLTRATVKAYRLDGLDSEDERLWTWEAAGDEHGFFQLSGLEAGKYRLELAAPDHLSSTLSELEVTEGAEVSLGRVRLAERRELTVEISPSLGPDGQPWTLSFQPVHPLRGDAEIVVQASDAGLAEVDDLRPAEYFVSVRGAQGETFRVDQLNLEEREYLFLEAPVVEVEGRVLQGDEPLAADVLVQTGAGDRSRFRSDEEGRFEGWMTEPDGDWLLTTVTWTRSGESHRRTVETVPEVDSGRLRLEVRLPAGTIFGQVMTSEGNAVQGATVRAVPSVQGGIPVEVTARSGRDGRFHLSGLDRALYYVQAGGDGQAASEIVPVDLSEPLPPSEVRLTLRPVRTLDLRVTSEGSGVPGATVVLEGLAPVPVTVERVTDRDGRIRVGIPEGMGQAVVTVLSASHPLWSTCRSLGDDGLHLDLPPVPAGHLVLELIDRRDANPSLARRPMLVTEGGGLLGLGTLVKWSQSRGGTRTSVSDGDDVLLSWQVPQVTPGAYGLVWASEPIWELAAKACGGALPLAEWAVTGPGTTAVVRFDSDAAPPSR